MLTFQQIQSYFVLDNLDIYVNLSTRILDHMFLATASDKNTNGGASQL